MIKPKKINALLRSSGSVLRTRSSFSHEQMVMPRMPRRTKGSVMPYLQWSSKTSKSLENIHIRYEDHVSCPGHPLAAGITLSNFKAETTDGNWVPMFIPGTSKQIVHKVWAYRYDAC